MNKLVCCCIVEHKNLNEWNEVVSVLFNKWLSKTKTDPKKVAKILEEQIAMSSKQANSLISSPLQHSNSETLESIREIFEEVVQADESTFFSRYLKNLFKTFETTLSSMETYVL